VGGEIRRGCRDLLQPFPQLDFFVPPMPQKTYCTPVFTIAARTALGSGNPNGCADELDCRTSQSTERCSDELPRVSHNSSGKQAPSSNSQKSSPTRHCPSNCPSDSCCSGSHDEPTLPEMPHCNTGCHGPNATTDCLSHRAGPEPSPATKEKHPSSSHGSSTSRSLAANTHRSCTPGTETLPLWKYTLNPKRPSGPAPLP